MIIIPLLISILYVISNIRPINILDTSSIWLTIFYVVYILLFLYLIIKNNKSIFNKEMFFFVIGISSNVVMMVSPTWGYRTSFATYIFLCIFSLIIIDNYIKDRKVYNTIASSVVVLCSIFYLTLYISVFRQYKENKSIIEKSIKDKSNVIEIYRYPSFANCNINPDDEYHLKVFKKYYNISEDTEIILLNNKWKYLILY